MDSTCLNYALTIIAIIIAFIAAFIIPKKILINQIFANLIQEYRSSQMGLAIKRIRDFYKYDCGHSADCQYIAKKYEEIYEREIKASKRSEYNSILHFQRRIVSQFYQQLSSLRFEYFFLIRISESMLKKYFSKDDLDIIQILYIIDGHHSKKIYSDQIQKLNIVFSNEKKHKSLNNMYCLYKETLEW